MSLCRNFLEITNNKYNDVTHHVTHVIQSGAEPDYESGNAVFTALQLAVQHNNVASVRLLLHYGARPVCQSPNYDMLVYLS